jgi:hypothetical protein
VAVTCFLGFGVALTFGFVYPINAILFEQAGGSAGVEEIRQMADRWIARDRLASGWG